MNASSVAITYKCCWRRRFAFQHKMATLLQVPSETKMVVNTRHQLLVRDRPKATTKKREKLQLGWMEDYKSVLTSNTAAVDYRP